MNKNTEIAKKVVDRIVDLINSGEPLPWVKPWGRSANTVTVVDGVKVVTYQPTAWNRRGQFYKGANAYLPAGEYITFKQCQAEGGKVMKGAKSWPVVYWNFCKKTETNPDTGEEEEITIPILKYYNVFNVKDCVKVDPKGREIPLGQKHNPGPRRVEIPITHTETLPENAADLLQVAEDIISDYVSRAGNGFYIIRDRVSDRAYYRPSADFVQVPMRSQFKSGAEYYSTLFHELGHSTGHATRLNRFTGKAACAAFGSEEYSREELVAESTAASVLNAIGLEEANSFRNSAAYIKSWSEHIQADPMIYVTAMTRAQAAFDLIIGADSKTEEGPED